MGNLDRPAERLSANFTDYDGIYLLSHSIGLPVRGTREATDGYFDAWEHAPTEAWPRWLDTIDDFRGSLAKLLGTSASSICPQANVSSGLAKILGSLPDLPDAPTVLLSEDAFPSIGFVCQQAGFDVRFIDRFLDPTDPAVWNDHLVPDVDVLIATHVHSDSGELIPVDDVGGLARDRGVITVVDVAQSAGVIPIDLDEWDVDFVVGSCVKWLSGGPGAGWLWADADRLERCEPDDVGWFSHADPFEFDIHRFRYADDALRFWGGSPTVLPFAVARHAIDTILDIGVDTIRTRNLVLTDRIIDALGTRVVSPHAAARRGGTCIVEADERVVDDLGAAGIAVDHRSRGIRISPHVHTAPSDIDRLIGCLSRIE